MMLLQSQQAAGCIHDVNVIRSTQAPHTKSRGCIFSLRVLLWAQKVCKVQ